MVIIRLALAITARVAGYLVSRPTSGKWLAHYFMASGSPLALPHDLERHIVWLCQSEYRSDLPNHMAIVDTPVDVDLFTTIGGFQVEFRDGLDDGEPGIYYQDTYDWHPGLDWQFNISILSLPFSITITGQDKWLDNLGKSFMTCGLIPYDIEPLIPPSVGDTDLAKAQAQFQANQKWLANIFKED